MSSHTDRSKLHLFQLNADLHSAKLQQLTWEIAAEELEMDVAEVNFDNDPREQEKDELKAKLVSVDSAISDIEAQIRQLSLAEQNSQVENLTADISSDLSPNASPRHQPIATVTSPPPLAPSPQPLACLSHPNTTLYNTAQSLTHCQSVENGSSKSSRSTRNFIPNRRDFALGMKLYFIWTDLRNMSTSVKWNSRILTYSY